MIDILFDFSILSRPLGTKRCIYQMVHLAKIAKKLGLNVFAKIDREVIKTDCLQSIKDHWIDYLKPTDIYFAKGDAFYKNDNWDKIKSLDSFKVCACSSDKTFREFTSTAPPKIGTAVQTRCDIYLPVNHTKQLLEQYPDKVILSSHPLDPRIIKFLRERGLEEAYLFDDVQSLRQAFQVKETAVARFLGNPRPNRQIAQKHCPWGEYLWNRFKPPQEYIEFLMGARGCIDIRGFGDKNIRFIEGVLFGKTIITVRTESQYDPILIDGYNCIIKDSWAELSNIEFDRERWLQIASNATECYLDGWSMQAQLKKILKVYAISINKN